ncbi:hypothetical protein HD597_011263 [Nonomuraea thailandensis]|uniref:Uncharacterized protein n=1 Tax=Nonomuraea thailandensis TaxID=1188745 RepID=A0A9X2H1I3_9ACTN|nr:hypothetical protein [Nonomuraea thailandensis]MCP2364243.1 hypothetical protein [Nonomuraea thailandensis]
MRVTNEFVIEILPAGPGSLDLICINLHQWAAQLDDARWTVKAHNGEQRMLAVEGTWLGQKVKVWRLIPLDGPDLAELSARPDLDTVAGAR